MIKSTLSFINILFIFTTALLSQSLHSEEVDKGSIIIDNKPWKTAWIKKDDFTWILIANFDQGELKTYFRTPPPTHGLGLCAENEPSKQELSFYFGQKFVSTVCQFEQWTDGAKSYSFKYEQPFERDGQRYSDITTAIIEEVEDSEDEIRYALYKTFSQPEVKENTTTFTEEVKHFSRLSSVDQTIHKNLKSRIDLLKIHGDFLRKQNLALLNLMRTLEEEKEHFGKISMKKFYYLIDKSQFPKITDMILDAKKLTTYEYLRSDINHIITLINKGNSEDIENWFEQFRAEILIDIDSYEKINIPLPQYKDSITVYYDNEPIPIIA